MMFTDRAVKALKPKSKRYEIWEDGNSGFGLRITPNGKKTWTFLYRFQGKARRLSLGSYPAVSLGQAREALLNARYMLTKQLDPAAIEQAEKDEIRRSPTFGEIAERYLDLESRPRKRSYRRDELLLERNILPKIGHVKLAHLTSDDVWGVIEAVEARGALMQANQVLSVIKSVLRWAVDRGRIKENVAASIKQPHRQTQRTRKLDAEEIRMYWNGLRANRWAGESVKNVLRMCLLTGQRVGEICGIHAREIDADYVWTIPAERNKGKRPHRVPLSRPVIEIIGTPTGFVFPSSRAQAGHTSKTTVSMEHKRIVEELGMNPFTVHDLRRTMVSHLADKPLSIPPHVISRIVGHKDVTMKPVTGVYLVHSYDEEKAEALEAWADRLREIVDSKADGNKADCGKEEAV